MSKFGDFDHSLEKESERLDKTEAQSVNWGILGSIISIIGIVIFTAPGWLEREIYLERDILQSVLGTESESQIMKNSVSWYRTTVNYPALKDGACKSFG